MKDRKSPLEELRERNKDHFTYSLNNGLGLLVLIVITIALGFFFSKNDSNLNLNEWLGLILRLLASLALYAQSDYYRKKVLVLLPETNVSLYATSISGILYIPLIGIIIFSQFTWLFYFGIMMLILTIKNGISWLCLNSSCPEHPFIKTLKRWTLAGLGYFCIIQLMIPFIYSLQKNCSNPDPLLFPLFEIKLSIAYVDIAPSLILFSAMLLSITRLSNNLDQIKKELNEFYNREN